MLYTTSVVSVLLYNMQLVYIEKEKREREKERKKETKKQRKKEKKTKY